MMPQEPDRAKAVKNTHGAGNRTRAREAPTARAEKMHRPVLPTMPPGAVRTETVDNTHGTRNRTHNEASTLGTQCHL